MTLTPQQLDKLRARVDHFKQVAQAYQLVIDEEQHASNGHAADQLPEKLRAVLADETSTRRGGQWSLFTRRVYAILAAAPGVNFTMPQIRAQLNGAGESFTQMQLQNVLSRMKVGKYLTGAYGRYRIDPKHAPFALPPVSEADVVQDVERKLAQRRRENKPRANAKAPTKPPKPTWTEKFRAAGQERSLQLLAVLDVPRTREGIIEALRGKNRKRSIVKATRIANAIGPMLRRGYITRDGDTYVKVKDYTPRA